MRFAGLPYEWLVPSVILRKKRTSKYFPKNNRALAVLGPKHDSQDSLPHRTVA